MESIVKFFQGGGIFMWPIGLMLIASSLVIAERIYMVLFKYSSDAASLMQKVQEHILDNNIEKALHICNDNKDSAVHQVFKAALLNADRPFDELQDHVDAATLQVVPKLQNRIPYLFTIANVATLMGLLGTIMGLISTFESVGAVDASQKQQLLSAGISTAMSTTAFGLVVAIPCMLAYGYLYNRINSMVDEIDHFSSKLLILLRTGSEYFDRFSSEEVISTKQEPKKKEGKSLDDNDKDMKNAA